MVLYGCKAPLRISFAGGCTEVDPYRSQFGGGYLLVFAPLTRRHIIRERLEAAGGQPVDFNFDHHSAVTWRVPE